MKVLIANIGSTSLKWRLCDFTSAAVVAQIGQVLSFPVLDRSHDDRCVHVLGKDAKKMSTLSSSCL